MVAPWQVIVVCNPAQSEAVASGKFDNGCTFSSEASQCHPGFLTTPLSPFNSSAGWVNVTLPDRAASQGMVGVMLQPSMTGSSGLYSPIVSWPCPPGWYCPATVPCAMPCQPGFVCVGPQYDNTTQRCMPGGMAPLAGTTICAGASVPVKCPAGWYCPTTAQQVPCPPHAVCIPGTVDPRPCPLMAVCEGDGSSVTAPLGGIVWVSAGVAAFTLLLSAYNAMRNLQRRRREGRAVKRGATHVTAWTSARSLELATRREGTGSMAGGLVDGLGGFGTPSSSTSVVPVSNPLTRAPSGNVSSLAWMCTPLQQQRACHLRMEGVSLFLKQPGCWGPRRGDRVLDGVTGTLRGGRVTAIMGGSGAGKTTLMTALLGKAHYGVQTGSVLLNGRVRSLREEPLKMMTGFVPQDDIMHPELTVKETLQYQAYLRMHAHASMQDVRALIQRVIQVTGLRDHKHKVIGDAEQRGLSGGQKKRVNIAMELVAEPYMLFLDEPTSGLDSTTSNDIMEVLRTLAREMGTNVMVVLHQPRWEIFRAFDDVVLLVPGWAGADSPGGKVAYWGECCQVQAYFAEHGVDFTAALNPADAIMDALGGRGQGKKFAEAWVQHRAKVPEPPVMPALVPTGRVRRSAWAQMVIFAMRSCVQQSRSIPSLATDNALLTFSSLVVGLMYRGLLQAHLATIVNVASMSVGMNAMQMALPCFGAERTVFWREASSGLSPTAYFVGKNIADLPRQLILPIFYLSCYVTLLQPWTSPTELYAITLAGAFASWGLGYLVSCIFPPKLAQVAAVVFALMWTTLSGITPTRQELRDNLWYVGTALNAMSYAKWMTEMYFVAEAKAWPPGWAPEVAAQMAALEYSDTAFRDGMLVLISIGIASRVLAYIMLRIMGRNHQL